MPKVKKFFYWLGWCLFLLVFILFFDYFFYLHYRTEVLRKELHEEKLTGSLLRVGYVYTNKKSSFVNFSEEKKEGIIRIGCFGDSFTHGDEVKDGYDYPALLQDILNTNGYSKVEVINFGVGGYSFSQAFSLWELVGKKYNLDYVILGPLCFLYDRDSTFRFDCPNKNIGEFYSRYILKNNGVERVDVVGDTIHERTLNYLRFFPPLRYLLYDRKAPSFLSAPIACLFSQKEIKNPFYYKKDIGIEVDEVYKRLLAIIADNAPQVILAHYGDNIVRIGRKLNKDNLFAVNVYRQEPFPYSAFENHNSPMGNRLVAKQIFDCLINKSESIFTVIKTADIDKELARKIRLEKLKLSEYKEIAVEINSAKVGRFYEKSEATVDHRVYCSEALCEPIKKDTFVGITSLLAIKGEGESILDVFFIPFDFELKEDMPLKIRFQISEGAKEEILGYVELLSPKLNIGIIHLGDVSLDHHKRTIELKEDNLLIKNHPFFTKSNATTVLLNDIPLLSANKNSGNKFTITSNRFLVIRADGREMVDVEKLDKEGIIYLSLYPEEGDPIRIPFAKWIKEYKEVPLGKPRAHFISKSE